MLSCATAAPDTLVNRTQIPLAVFAPVILAVTPLTKGWTEYAAMLRNPAI